MSFACHIWEFPAPADSFELRLIREAYYHLRTAQNPRYLELARRLTAKRRVASVAVGHVRAARAAARLDAGAGDPRQLRAGAAEDGYQVGR
jgi:hypothetical protein